MVLRFAATKGHEESLSADLLNPSTRVGGDWISGCAKLREMSELPAPSEGIALTHFVVAEDVERSRAFYSEVLGGEVVMEGEPSMVQLANAWIIINVGGGPTEDKPEVILETPRDLNRVSSFLNIRVADIQAVYDDWRSRGAEFLTPPMDRGAEIRCYLRDPDGHLIEVGQST